MFSSLIKGIAVLALTIAGFFGVAKYSPQQAEPPPVSIQQPVGATIPIVVSRFETSLQSSISDSATSMTLVSGTDRAGNSLSGFHCFTIDEGTSVVEDVCGTASGTAVSALTRGISPITGTSSVTSLKFVHRRGASVKITDYPQLAINSRILNGDETLPNVLKYDSSVSTSTIAANPQALVSVNLLNETAFNGAPNASLTVRGIVEAGTAAEILAGTGTGGTGALLFAPGSLYNATSSATTLIPVTRASGKLHQGFLPLNEDLTFSGVIVHSATTTLATTTVNGLATFTQNVTIPTTPVSAAHAASKSYVDSLVGTKIFATTTDVTVVNTVTPTNLISQTIPGGTLGTNGVVRVRLTIGDFGAASSGRTLTLALKYGATTMITITALNPGTSTHNGFLEFYIFAAGATNSQEASSEILTSVDHVTQTTNSSFIYEMQTAGSAAIDSTADQTVAVTATWSGTDANATITVSNSLIEKIR